MTIFNTLWRARSCCVAFAAATVILAVPPPSTAQKPQSRAQQTVRPQSDQARRALDFFAKLDSGQPAEVKNAYRYIFDEENWETYPLSRLQADARGRRLAAVNRTGQFVQRERQLTRAESASYSRYRTAWTKPYIVCIVEVSRSRSVTYVSATMVLRLQGSKSLWMVADFQVSSSQHPLCR